MVDTLEAVHLRRPKRKYYLASRVPIAKDCADCGLEDCGLKFANSRFRAPGPPQAPLSSTDP
eukprot:1066667-Alexandrium_andersonii.AAC.1